MTVTVPVRVFVKLTTAGLTPLAVNHQGPSPATTLSFNLAPGASLSDAVAALQQASAGPGELPEAALGDVYYAGLLRHLGCSSTAHEETRLMGDELELRTSFVDGLGPLLYVREADADGAAEPQLRWRLPASPQSPSVLR